MYKKIFAISTIALSLFFSSCALLSDVASQIKGIANLANCEYSLNNVGNVSVAGVDVKKVAGGNISLTDVAKLTAGIATKNIPIAMDFNVGIKNPTQTNANLNVMDWIVNVENTELARGTTNRNYTISAGRTSTVPLGVSTNMYDIFSKRGIESLKAFASSFKSDGTSSKVAIKVRPTLKVGTYALQTPNYITIEKNVGKKATNTKTVDTKKS
ncbi:MAG: hypothetical protein IJL38_04575 [Bacteroidales bacterium]|nr:hypothetical protein [Bacteroidales bacterium]